MVAHRRQLPRLNIIRVGRVIDRLGRPYSYVAVFQKLVCDQLPLCDGLFDIPPAAVTRRWPSGETWQL